MAKTRMMRVSHGLGSGPRRLASTKEEVAASLWGKTGMGAAPGDNVNNDKK
jgi:hypothetical protein